MVRLVRSHRPAFVVLSLLGAMLAGATLTRAAPDTATDPILIAAARSDAPNAILVRGEGFTPGGRVYVALYDRSGSGPDETRLAADTPSVPGKNGSADPAAEPGRAVAFGAAVGDWLSASPTVYGRDNSADPAAGFNPGGTIGALFLVPCGMAVAVWAFDRSTASWSNWVNARLDC